MVFLAITPDGLKEALRIAVDPETPVWCGADAMSEEDYGARKGRNLSRFNYALGDRNAPTLERAVETINEHHPDEVVWVEAPTASE